MSSASKIGLPNIVVALLKRHWLHAVGRRMEHQLVFVEQALTETVLARIRVNVIPGNVDEVLQILSRWFEESRSIAIGSKESTPSNAATTYRVAGIGP